eukprot:scaffold125903_cov34-Tisochrysis_lutea.AAC.3
MDLCCAASSNSRSSPFSKSSRRASVACRDKSCEVRCSSSRSFAVAKLSAWRSSVRMAASAAAAQTPDDTLPWTAAAAGFWRKATRRHSVTYVKVQRQVRICRPKECGRTTIKEWQEGVKPDGRIPILVPTAASSHRRPITGCLYRPATAN